MGRTKCHHGEDAPRYVGGRCKLCALESATKRAQAKKDEINAYHRRYRAESKTTRLSGGGSGEVVPPRRWGCPVCGTRTKDKRWLCSKECLNIVIDSALAGVDYKLYGKQVTA